MAKRARPPANTRPPNPREPRGSFGGPPPEDPLCLIISRNLQVNSSAIKVLLPIHRISCGHGGGGGGRGRGKEEEERREFEKFGEKRITGRTGEGFQLQLTVHKPNPHTFWDFVRVSGAPLLDFQGNATEEETNKFIARGSL